MSRPKTSRIQHQVPILRDAGPRLEQIPCEKWPAQPDRTPSGLQEVVEVWLSRQYLVQVFEESNGFERLTICRTAVDQSSGRWKQHIPWHVLQRLKGECGRGDRWAVECFPPDDQVVDVANMRHLFLLDSPPMFGWHPGREVQPYITAKKPRPTCEVEGPPEQRSIGTARTHCDYELGHEGLHRFWPDDTLRERASA